MSLIEYFKRKGDQHMIPFISNSEWKKFREKYPKDEIREALAEYIHHYNVGFPFQRITEEEVKTLFHKFCNYTPELYYPVSVDEKIKYRYKYTDKPLGVIGKSHIYNAISNYYQQQNRLSCGSVYQISPVDIWNDKEKLSKMNWHFWRDGVLEGNPINDKAFRAAFRLGTYTSTQFKPEVAKLIYSYHSAKNILDISCGWGDRLAGFYATSNTELYVGCDPNPKVFESYKKQCIDYERFLGYDAELIETTNYFECIGSKTVKIWNRPAEDIPWRIYEGLFDLMFTSPPYFETEKYGEGTGKEENQSWNRYNSFETWKNDFLFNVLEKVWGTIKKDGWMMINIINPISKKKRHDLCDDMVDYISSFDDANYIGQLLMELRMRPNAGSLTSVSGEPIWVFRKGNDKYIRRNTLEDFF
jgi:hypothetical protein